jgi:hypothetical protein
VWSVPKESRETHRAETVVVDYEVKMVLGTGMVLGWILESPTKLRSESIYQKAEIREQSAESREERAESREQTAYPYLWP